MDTALSAFNSLVNRLPMGDQVWVLLIFMLVLSILVFVHEYGHYKAARMVGVKVKTFSIGFGKELFGWTDKNDTRWKFSAIPLGGYVELFGADKDEIKTEQEKTQAFYYKSVWRRIWVVFAGPLANFLFALVAMMLLFAFYGEQKMMPQVGEVLAETPAQAAGLQNGDIILTMNGVAIVDWDMLTGKIVSDGHEPIHMLVQSADSGEERHVLLVPEIREKTNHFGENVRVPFAGVSPSFAYYTVEHSSVEGLWRGAVAAYDYTAMTLQAFGKIITGSISKENLGGPITIAKVSAKAAEVGFYPLIIFMVIISINLGIINLLPIPVLDGGHLVYYLVEIVKGSPLSEGAQSIGNRVGVAAVIALMTLAVGNDIHREFKTYLAKNTHEVSE